MKFGKFVQYYKVIFLPKNPTKNVGWKLVPGPFQFSKNPLQKRFYVGQYADLEKF